MHPAGFHFDGDFVVAVDCVKVRDPVLAVEHTDHDTEEAGDFRHDEN
jgi:hypothetical protein